MILGWHPREIIEKGKITMVDKNESTPKGATENIGLVNLFRSALGRGFFFEEKYRE